MAPFLSNSDFKYPRFTCHAADVCFLGSFGAKIRIYDLKTGAQMLEWQAHNHRVIELRTEESGTGLISQTISELKIWVLQSSQLLYTVPVLNHLCALSNLKHCLLALAKWRTVELVDFTTGQKLSELTLRAPFDVVIDALSLSGQREVIIHRFQQLRLPISANRTLGAAEDITARGWQSWGTSASGEFECWHGSKRFSYSHPLQPGARIDDPEQWRAPIDFCPGFTVRSLFVFDALARNQRGAAASGARRGCALVRAEQDRRQSSVSAALRLAVARDRPVRCCQPIAARVRFQRPPLLQVDEQARRALASETAVRADLERAS